MGRTSWLVLEKPDARDRKPLEAFLQPDTVKLVYTHGHPRPELISPDNWNMDLHYLDRPNARRVQLDFFYDYRTNVSFTHNGRPSSEASSPKRLSSGDRTTSSLHARAANPISRISLMRRSIA